MEINLSNWLSRGCMELLLTGRPLWKLLCQGRGRRIEEFGMFVLFGNLMIGRWMKGAFSLYLGSQYSFNGCWRPDEMEVEV